jgi:hypothetical protein
MLWSKRSSVPLTLLLVQGVMSVLYFGRFTSGKKNPVHIVQEAGWALGPVWTGAENLAPTGIRSPDRYARSDSLYRLSYPGPYIMTVGIHNRSRPKVPQYSTLCYGASVIHSCVIITLK